MESPVRADDPTAEAVSPEVLAGRLASKLCHDFANSVGGIVTGLDLLGDPSAKDMRDDALELIATSARKLTDQLAFARMAYGASAGAEGVGSEELKRLAEGAYAPVRADLDWGAMPATLPKSAAQVLLGLAQIAAAALPFGGVARVEATEASGGGLVLSVAGEGPRSRLHPEVLAGLAGEPLGDGLMARWVQAYFVAALARAGGGRVLAEAEGERISLTARIPA